MWTILQRDVVSTYMLPGPCWWLWSVLLLEVMYMMSVVHGAMYMSMFYAAGGGHVGVWCLVSLTVGDATGDHKNFVDDHGPCCFWKPCRHPWSLLPLAVTGREASFVVSKEDCKLIIESERNWGLLGQPLFIPQGKGTLPIQEASKESTYNMWQRYLGTVLHSWCLLATVGKEELSYL